MFTNNAIYQYNKQGKFIGRWFWKAILLKEAEKTRAAQKEKRKSSCHDQSKLWAHSSKYCKSDLAPASVGSKVLQPPGAKCCWIKILQKQVNFVPAGFVLLWVSSVPPKAGTEDGGSINTKARDVSNLTEMGAYIHAPAGSVGDLVVSSSTSNECGITTKKREGAFRLRTAWKKESKVWTIILCRFILSPRFWQRNTILSAFIFHSLWTLVQMGNNSTFRLQQNILFKIAYLATYTQVS